MSLENNKHTSHSKYSPFISPSYSTPNHHHSAALMRLALIHHLSAPPNKFLLSLSECSDYYSVHFSVFTSEKRAVYVMVLVHNKQICG